MKFFFSVFYDTKFVHGRMFKPINLYGQVEFLKGQKNFLKNFFFVSLFMFQNEKKKSVGGKMSNRQFLASLRTNFTC
jgi:hypothetical protein